MKSLLLIDAHAMIHRAYHALPATLTSKDGTPTNAIYGFFLIIQKVISDFQPSHVAICFDTPARTFRKDLFKEYQSKRPAMENTLSVQIPVIKELLALGGIECYEKPGFEADDVIGTLAEQYKPEFDRVLILTGDRDLLQLVDKKVFVITPKFGVANFNLFTPEEVLTKFGVTPEHIPDYKALVGDSSDNYNTAKGIGPKTALKLLGQFNTIEKLVANTDKIENEKWRAILEEYKETIVLFKKIATIVRDVDVKSDDTKMEFRGFSQDMKPKLNQLSLYTLQDKLFKTVIKKEEPAKKIVEKKPADNTSQMDLF
jgi:DNA polymerase-1